MSIFKPENIPPSDFEEPESPIKKLLWIMACLRDPDGGCAWDLEQDFKSIAPYTIEEAYEVADAIDRGDMNDLKEELGDLLLQAVFHAQIASEQNLFDFDDVVYTVVEKMISHHPHVFGDIKAENAHTVTEIWEAQKDKEQGHSKSALDGVTLGLPALLRASKLQKKAAKTGFEWKDLEGCFAKFEEELNELKNAKTKDEIEDELGDVLFCLANYARMQGINPEEALRKTNQKFIKRFQGMEKAVKDQNRSIGDILLSELLDLWAKQK